MSAHAANRADCDVDRRPPARRRPRRSRRPASAPAPRRGRRRRDSSAQKPITGRVRSMWPASSGVVAHRIARHDPRAEPHGRQPHGDERRRVGQRQVHRAAASDAVLVQEVAPSRDELRRTRRTSTRTTRPSGASKTRNGASGARRDRAVATRAANVDRRRSTSATPSTARRAPSCGAVAATAGQVEAHDVARLQRRPATACAPARR